MKPVVALVGRPNVGKSTLFNRLTKTRDALVDDFPGVTRDRNFGNVTWAETEFTLVDTGGFAEDDMDVFAPRIREQIDMAVEDADAVILLMDAKNGLSPFEHDMIHMFRGLEKPIFYAVNKIDGPEQEHKLLEFYELGIEPLYPLSSAHGYGVNDLMDALVASFPEPLQLSEATRDINENAIRVAVIGRPNVGKSSLINRIIGENRLLVSDIPGTTRDAVDTYCEVDGQSFLFIDTAGIRRKAKVKEKIEKFSVIKSLRSLDRCDIALVLLDASEGITDQDVTVAGYAHDKGRGCILILNKWDIVDKDTHSVKTYTQQVRDAAKFLPFAPVMTISALTGKRVQRIFPLIREIYHQYTQRISTAELNRILQSALAYNEPPMHKKKRLKFYYITQIATRPPTLVVFVNYPEGVHFSYKRYLSNRIRQETGLDKCPLRILYRQRTGRIEFGKRKYRKQKPKRKS